MQKSIPLQSPAEVQVLLGINDRNARLFRAELSVSITVRKGELVLQGEDADVAAAARVIEEAVRRYRAQGQLDERDVEALLRAEADETRSEDPSIVVSENVLRNRSGRMVAPRSRAQRDYVRGMHERELVFGIGPAGTGKTYLAVSMAVRMLREGAVRRIILTRPAVEAGEKLGFLPGTFEAKVNPYLRPLYDALFDLVDPAQIRKFQESDVIEVAPLAYMRGRTLSDAFIILDEAQNTTPAQMKMFLTRMGEGSRMVITGDVTQVDLPSAAQSGLVHAERVLQGLDEIRICRFAAEDIIRHPVVARIVRAYERAEGN